MRWIAERDLAVCAALRLFCLPHAGSGAAGFYRWRRLLPASIAVCPVRLPGRDERLGEMPLRSVEEIVNALHAEAREALSAPYALFGHSMGSLLAYEWARRIAAEGMNAPEHVFVSGREAPALALGHSDLHLQADEAMLHGLGARYGGAPEALLADEELKQLFVPVVRADLQVVETYAYEPSPLLACPVSAVAGAGDRSVSDAGLRRWAEMSSGSFATRRLPGGHFFHFEDGQAELLRYIGGTLGD